jgi:hypothetical protein
MGWILGLARGWRLGGRSASALRTLSIAALILSSVTVGPALADPGEQMRIRSFFDLGGYLYASGENDCDADDYPGCVQRGFELWRLAGPPSCDVVATLRPGQNGFTGNLAEQEVGVQAPGGLESISNVEISDGVVYWPDFTPGTTSTVIVTAIKTTSGVATSWSFDAVDEWGQTTYCG